MFARENPNEDVGKSTRSVGRLLFLALVIGLVATVGVSYLRDVYRQRAFSRAVTNLRSFKVRCGGIGGWPLGNQRIVWFEPGAHLTDADAGSLLELASSKSRADYLTLKLENTDLTDQALSTLASLDGINVVDVSGCLITDRGAHELQQKMRVTKVVRVEHAPR